jgi:hypothetical protein
MMWISQVLREPHRVMKEYQTGQRRQVPRRHRHAARLRGVFCGIWRFEPKL